MVLLDFRALDGPIILVGYFFLPHDPAIILVGYSFFPRAPAELGLISVSHRDLEPFLPHAPAELGLVSVSPRDLEPSLEPGLVSMSHRDLVPETGGANKGGLDVPRVLPPRPRQGHEETSQTEMTE